MVTGVENSPVILSCRELVIKWSELPGKVVSSLSLEASKRPLTSGRCRRWRKALPIAATFGLCMPCLSAQSPSPLEPGRVQTQGPPHPLTTLLPCSQLSALAVFWPNTQFP